MATQPTNLPVPSESPRDLKFNASKIDEFVTSLLNTYTDRFGNEHYTIEGINRIALQAISNFGYITLDSFEDGNTITLPNQVLRYEANGEYYRWDGTLPKTVPAGSTPESSGGVGPGRWVSVGDASLRGDLSSHDQGRGASLVSLNNAGSVQDAIKYATPEMYLHMAADETSAIQMAIDNNEVIHLEPSDYLIVRTIEIPDGRIVYLGGSKITASTGTDPIFRFTGKNIGLTMIGGSGVVTGTASSFLEAVGDSDKPVNADYVKQIRLYGVHVSSSTITYSVLFKKAVRQVFIDSCMFYTVNGIVSSGKTVELACTKSIVFGATSATDTVGIGIYSTGTGGPYYNEGWHFTDCTIDNFERTFDVSDIYVLTVNGGFIGNNSNTGFAMYFGEGNTTHCREINVNTVIGGRVKFNNATVERLCHAKFSGEITYCKGGSGVCFAIGDNISGVDVIGMKFTTNTGHIVSTVGNGSANIHFSDISTDSSHTSGILFSGTNGGSCSISDFSYSGAGEALSLPRPVNLSNVPVIGVATSAFSIRNDFVSSNKTVAIGSNINQLQMTIAQNSRISININIAYLGGAGSTTQVIGITAPSGTILPNGSNSMQFTLPATAGSVTANVIATVSTAFTNGSFIIDNRAGNTLTVIAGSHLSVTLSN